MERYDGKLADYWSLNIILYIMLVAPPPVATPIDIIDLINRRELNWYDEDIAENAKDMVYSLLKPDPQKRLTAKGIKRHARMHDLRGIDFSKNGMTEQVTGEASLSVSASGSDMDLRVTLMGMSSRGEGVLTKRDLKKRRWGVINGDCPG